MQVRANVGDAMKSHTIGSSCLFDARLDLQAMRDRNGNPAIFEDSSGNPWY